MLYQYGDIVGSWDQTRFPTRSSPVGRDGLLYQTRTGTPHYPTAARHPDKRRPRRGIAATLPRKADSHAWYLAPEFYIGAATKAETKPLMVPSEADRFIQHFRAYFGLGEESEPFPVL